MIPKIIHYCWLGGKPLTPLAKKCVESWQRIMPDYEIKRWDESNYDFKKNKFMANACRQKKWGFVPDYARLDIIYNYGGIYFDNGELRQHRAHRRQKDDFAFTRRNDAPSRIGIPPLRPRVPAGNTIGYAIADKVADLVSDHRAENPGERTEAGSN